MTVRRVKTGKQGEKIALAFLKNLGYSVLEKNYRTPFGEIDIICMENRTTVFVEVRSAGEAYFCPPEYSITKKKQIQISKSALCYIKSMRLEKEPSRFDVVLVERPWGRSPKTRLIKDAFMLDNIFRY